MCSVMQSNERLREIPVIFLTAKTLTSDKVMGFSLGADDFITKPFDALELKARIESQLRKRDQRISLGHHLVFGDLEIDKNMQRAQIKSNGVASPVELTPIEFKILLFLCLTPNQAQTRDCILNAVWGETVHVFSRSVDTHISKLRKKLGVYADAIESVAGSGYRFHFQESRHAPKVEITQQFPIGPTQTIIGKLKSD